MHYVQIGASMEHCIFCKIVNGDLPGMKIYEDEHTCVLLDIADDVNGHMAAVPKKHVTIYWTVILRLWHI